MTSLDACPNVTLAILIGGIQDPGHSDRTRMNRPTAFLYQASSYVSRLANLNSIRLPSFALQFFLWLRFRRGVSGVLGALKETLPLLVEVCLLIIYQVVRRFILESSPCGEISP